MRGITKGQQPATLLGRCSLLVLRDLLPAFSRGCASLEVHTVGGARTQPEPESRDMCQADVDDSPKHFYKLGRNGDHGRPT